MYSERWLSRDISAVAGSLCDKFSALIASIEERPSKTQNYIFNQITDIYSDLPQFGAVDINRESVGSVIYNAESLIDE
jgi:hypothetical protein